MHLGDIQPFVSVGKKTSAKKSRQRKADCDREELLTMPLLPCTILANKTVES